MNTSWSDVFLLVPFPSEFIRYVELSVARGAGSILTFIRRHRAIIGLLSVVGLAFVGHRLWDAIPHARSHISFPWWLLLFYLIIGLAYLSWQSQRRLIVDEFVDHTGDQKDTTAKGVGKALAVNLTELSGLLRTVDRQRATSSHDGPDLPVNPTIYVGDVDALASGALSVESKITLWGVEVPIGAVLWFAARVTRGQRITGSLHRYNNTLVLIAERLGTPDNHVWREEGKVAADATQAHRTQALCNMVAELACQVFVHVSSVGTDRWQAMASFREGMSRYQECLSSREDRRLKLKEAERHLIDALVQDENFALAYYNLGVVYTELEQREAAETAFLRAAERDPGKWHAHYALADLRLRMAYAASDPARKRELYRSVIQLCDHVISLDPGNARSYNLRSLALRRSARPNISGRGGGGVQARPGERLGQALRDRRTAITKAWRALCKAEALGQGARAPAETRMLALRRTAVVCANNLGCLYHLAALSEAGSDRRRNLWQAVGLMKQALMIDESETTLYANLGDLYYCLGYLDKAADAYHAAVYRDPNNPSHAARSASVAVLMRDEEQIGDLWERSLHLAFGASTNDIISTATQCRRAGVRGSCLATSMSVFLRHIGRLLRKGDRLSLQSEHRMLKTELKNLRSRVLASSGADRQVAQEERVLCEWKCSQIALTLCLHYMRNDRPWRAKHYVQSWIAQLESRRSSSEFELEWIGKPLLGRLVDASDYAQALLLTESSADKNPFNPYLQQVMGGLYSRLGEYDRAFGSWQSAHAWKPDDADTHFFMGLYRFKYALSCRDMDCRESALKEADDFLNQALELYRQDLLISRGRAHYWLGRLGLEVGQYDVAISHFHMASTLDYLPLMAAYYIALANLDSKDYNEAADRFRDLGAEALNAQMAGPPDTISFDQDQGEGLSATELLIRSCWGQSYSYLERDVKDDDALDLIGFARNLIPGLPDQAAKDRCSALCSDCEGWALFKQGRALEAIAELENSIATLADPRTYLHLAIACESRSDTDASEQKRRLLLRRAQACCHHVRELDRVGNYVRDLDMLMSKLSAKGILEQAPPQEPGQRAA